MKRLKKLSCLTMAMLLVLLTACSILNPEPTGPEKPVVGGQNSGGEITFGEQTFSTAAEELVLNLEIRSNEILDLSLLTRCTQLRRLSINLTVVPHIYYDQYRDPHLAEQTPTDLTPLASLVNLEYLKLNVGRIDDLAPLAHLQKLNYLVLWIDGEIDLAPLAACGGLAELALGGRGTVDLTPIRGFTALTGLRVDVYDADWNTPDLSGLSGTPNLETLSTGASNGLSKLENVPLKELIDINDSGNVLENLPRLATLTHLEFSDEHLSDIRSLLAHPGITEIVLEVGAQDIENFTVIKSADDPMLDYLITAIPAAQLRDFLASGAATITIVLDQNRAAGALE